MWPRAALRARARVQDVDGMQEHGVLMALPISRNQHGHTVSYAAERQHEIHGGVVYNSQPISLSPGKKSSVIELSLPSYWESIVRIAGEVYQRHRLCMHFEHGVADVTLRCDEDWCSGSEPFALSIGFDYTLGAIGHRPCHEPARCVPEASLELKPLPSASPEHRASPLR